MDDFEPFVDIHCHLLPGIDDGAKSWDESLQMAKMAADDGFGTMIVTPHQNGAYAHNRGEMIRGLTLDFQEFLDQNDVPLRVLPGGDIRIEDGMIDGLKNGDVMSLADRRRHVLLELPHELYFPLEPVLEDLEEIGMVGILSHPERNFGILNQPSLLAPLVERGCLMQVTAGSLMGTFGPQSQSLSEWMLQEGMVHFLATDAHGPKSRRPLMHRAFERTAELAGWNIAYEVCCDNPSAVAAGDEVEPGFRVERSRGWFDWLFKKAAA